MKRVMNSQILCIIYSVIAMVTLVVFIRFELEIAVIIILGDVVFLGAIVAFINSKLGFTKWIDVLLISFPFLIYALITFGLVSQVIPTTIGENDYGVGLVLFFSFLGYWFSVLLGSLASVIIRKIKVQGLSS